ncbi:MAG: mechanosensitive ion channel family protein [Myxococcota bacterium]
MNDAMETLRTLEPGWLRSVIGLGGILAVALLAWSVHSLVLWGLNRRISEEARQLGKGLRRSTRVLVMFGAVLATRPLWQLPGDWSELIGHLTKSALIAIVAWVAVAFVSTVSHLYLEGHDMTSDDNLEARRQHTKVRVLRRSLNITIGTFALGAVLYNIPYLRQFGVSLFASAGVAGLAIGIAARPVLSNLIAGIQLAITQPIRIEDAVLVENEWGWIEEITATYVVVRIWDWRRLVVPLTYFVENPVQNWTRQSGSIIGSVFLHLDYKAPIGELRQKLNELLDDSSLWDGNVRALQVTEARRDALEVRALMSAKTSPIAWDLRCEIREKLIGWLQQVHPYALPRTRAELSQMDAADQKRTEGPPGSGSKEVGGVRDAFGGEPIEEPAA